MDKAKAFSKRRRESEDSTHRESIEESVDEDGEESSGSCDSYADVSKSRSVGDSDNSNHLDSASDLDGGVLEPADDDSPATHRIRPSPARHVTRTSDLSDEFAKDKAELEDGREDAAAGCTTPQRSSPPDTGPASGNAKESPTDTARSSTPGDPLPLGTLDSLL